MAYIIANIMYFIGIALSMLAMTCNFITPFVSFGLFGYGIYTLIFTDVMFGFILIGSSIIGGAFAVFLTTLLGVLAKWSMGLIDKVIE